MSNRTAKLGLMLAVIGVVGCASGGQLVYTGTLAPESDAFTLAMGELATMGYAVVNADRDAGFIQAERRSGGRLPWITQIDVLTVNITTDEFSVIGRTDEIGLSGSRGAWNPSNAVAINAVRLQKALMAAYSQK